MRLIIRIFAFFLMQFIIAYICFAAYNQAVDIAKWPREIAQNFGVMEGCIGSLIIVFALILHDS